MGRLVICTWLFSALALAPAAASPPENLADELTDHLGLLSPEEVTSITTVQDELVADKGLQLFVVLVDDFDGMPPQSWMEQTAVRSGLGEQDMAVAIAADSRELTLRVLAATGLDRRAVDRAEESARTELTAGRPTAAVMAVVDGLGGVAQVDATDRATRLTWWVAGLLILLSLLGGLFWKLTSAARARRRDAEDLQAARKLARRTSTATVSLDDALEATRLEVEFAAAEFEPPLVASIRETVTATSAEAVDAHRRRAAVVTGPVDDPQWQQPPAAALAELREIDTLTRTALTRLTTVATQLTELRRQSDLVPTRIVGLRELASTPGVEPATASQVAQLLDRAESDVAAGRPEAALLPLQTVVALLSPGLTASGSAAAPSPGPGAPGR